MENNISKKLLSIGLSVLMLLQVPIMVSAVDLSMGSEKSSMLNTETITRFSASADECPTKENVIVETQDYGDVKINIAKTELPKVTTEMLWDLANDEGNQENCQINIYEVEKSETYDPLDVSDRIISDQQMESEIISQVPSSLYTGAYLYNFFRDTNCNYDDGTYIYDFRVKNVMYASVAKGMSTTTSTSTTVTVESNVELGVAGGVSTPVANLEASVKSSLGSSVTKTISKSTTLNGPAENSKYNCRKFYLRGYAGKGTVSVLRSSTKSKVASGSYQEASFILNFSKDFLIN